jgi:hypothetical protein
VTDAHVPAEPAEEWLASTDEERWSSAATWPTREAAIAGAPAELDVEPGCGFWVGRKAEVTTSGRDWSDDIIEALGMDAYDQAGEASEDWPCATRAAEDELTEKVQEVIDAWLDRHGLRPTFFKLDDVEEHQAPDGPWWCPKCRVAVELGEEAWKSDQLVPGPDSRALHGDCGTELEAR